MKRCARCKELIHLAQFGVDRGQADHHAISCRLCARLIARIAMRRWLSSHRELARERVRARRRKNPDHARELARESQRRSRQRHPERNMEIKRHRKATHPEAWRQEVLRGSRCRKARIRGAKVRGKVDFQRIIERDGRVCHICGLSIVATEPLECDHIMPVSKGGPHVEMNLSPSPKKCNRQKANTWPWLRVMTRR